MSQVIDLTGPKRSKRQIVDLTDAEPMALLTNDILREVTKSLRPGDLARLGMVDTRMRDISTVQLAEILADPRLTKLAQSYKSRLRRPFVHFGGPGTPFFSLTRRDPELKVPLRQAVVYNDTNRATTQEESMLEYAKYEHAEGFYRDPRRMDGHNDPGLKRARIPTEDRRLFADGVPTSSWVRDQLNRQITRQ